MDKKVQENKWEIEEAARTLIRAEQIKSNKQFLSKVNKELVKQRQAVSKAIGKVRK